MKYCRLLLFVFLIGSCKAQRKPVDLKTNKDNNTLLWEVRGKGLPKPCYVFGTFHLLCKEDIHFSEALLGAMKKVNEIYLELDKDDPPNLLSGILLMNMNDGKKLKDIYAETEYKKLEDFFKDSLGSSLSFFQSMKPAFLESLLYPKLLPCKNISGVEQELIIQAKKDKKEIRGLESMAFQASVFDSIPYKEQAKELLKTIDSLSTYRKFFDTLIMVYKAQRLDEIEKLFSKSEFGMQDNQDILLNNRNKNWVDQLKVIMKKESVFIAVGAGHLVGEKGLIALLRKEGYILRAIENK